ncbi:ABC transporter ATP-binding protein [Nocardiopsis synnemataformans]|uniref:ABC transporter ATP-binding protein n=1 Tax=Nocardiopsis synnemataformans TaxID=61305 RepID=UPI003EC0CA03
MRPEEAATPAGRDAHGAESGDGRHSAAHLMSADHVRKHYPLKSGLPFIRRSKAVRAVSDVSFDLDEGQTLAVVGESGCGKSTTARMLLQLDRPTSGSVRFRGRDIWALGKADQLDYRRAVQAVFQDPSSALSPRRRVREIVTEPLITIGGTKASEARKHAAELLGRVGLTTDVADRFPHQLSGGMKQRVAIAQALATNPSVIVLDEPVSALDVSTSAEILNLLKAIQADLGVSYVLITHNLAIVRFLADKVAAMYLGGVVESGSNHQVFGNAVHPYTLALMSASVPDDGSIPESERIIVEGDIPSPVHPPSGCRFRTRCWLAQGLGDPERCRTETPQPTEITPGHRAACHFLGEAASSSRRRVLLASLGEHQAPLAVGVTRCEEVRPCSGSSHGE